MKLLVFIIYTPFPTFPANWRGKELKIRLSPLGGNGKGGYIEYNESN
jgi:hypothetical protein